jgi:hypothetical protein
MELACLTLLLSDWLSILNLLAPIGQSLFSTAMKNAGIGGMSKKYISVNYLL